MSARCHKCGRLIGLHLYGECVGPEPPDNANQVLLNSEDAEAVGERSFAAPAVSDASTKPQMSDEELANKLLCVLTQEMIRKSELFDYLCWLEESGQRERVPDAPLLVLASDGRTCWGKSYAAAVASAMKYDEKPYGEYQNSD